MTRLYRIVSDRLDVYFNQALEKYLLDHVEEDSIILYLWQNEKTVVIGRNQDAYGECDVERLEKDGGHLARRISGGGAVYHDTGNLNFTFLANRKEYDVSSQNKVILDALKDLGIDAKRNGRNDLEIDGRKFSGHAYYNGKESCLHHGTLMLEVDEEALCRYLNVSYVKLHSKNVPSVRSRIINLKSVRPDLDIAMMKEALITSFEENYGSKSEVLSFDEDEVRKIEEGFADRDWYLGKKEEHEFEKERRFDWGVVKIRYDRNEDILTALDVYTDALYFDVSEKELKGLLNRRIKDIDMEGRSEQLKEIVDLLKEE